MCVAIAALGMTAMQTFMVGATVASTAIAAQSSANQAKATSQIASNNATMAGYAAKDAQVKGEEDAQAVLRRAAAVKSSQRVGLAAHGLDLGYGTAADLQDQTDFFAQTDATTARNNAGREAWRIGSQAQDFRSQASAATYNGNMAVAGSLIGGGAQVADKWYTMKGK
jgi:hypothetical protein